MSSYTTMSSSIISDNDSFTIIVINSSNNTDYSVFTRNSDNISIIYNYFDGISWFKRQSLTFMILKYRFNSFRDG